MEFTWLLPEQPLSSRLVTTGKYVCFWGKCRCSVWVFYCFPWSADIFNKFQAVLSTSMLQLWLEPHGIRGRCIFWTEIWRKSGELYVLDLRNMLNGAESSIIFSVFLSLIQLAISLWTHGGEYMCTQIKSWHFCSYMFNFFKVKLFLISF